MSEIRITEPHQLPSDEARRRVASFEALLDKYRVKAVWKGNDADIKGTGVSGSIHVTDAAVNVVVKLGLLARAAGIDASRLEQSIRRRLGESLRSQA